MASLSLLALGVFIGFVVVFGLSLYPLVLVWTIEVQRDFDQLKKNMIAKFPQRTV